MSVGGVLVWANAEMTIQCVGDGIRKISNQLLPVNLVVMPTLVHLGAVCFPRSRCVLAHQDPHLSAFITAATPRPSKRTANTIATIPNKQPKEVAASRMASTFACAT